MFNFKELDLDRREDAGDLSSFVGIRRNPQNNKLEFRVPKGFDNFPEKDFNATKDLFFKMYRTFKKFEKKFEDTETHLPEDKKSARKDNIETMGQAYRFKDKEDNPVVLYSKISVIENLLDAYKDLALDVIERRVGRNEKIDYAKIDQYLHKAIYLPNDVIYLDEMELPRYVLRYESATIIDLFCFILHELKRELNEEKELDERVNELAHRFKEQYLSCDQSLFNEETFEGTIIILKDSLDDIDKITAYKDEDYWRLYEAIECFLYGELDMQSPHEDGIFWGIQDFWSIWEDMCNTYAFDKWNSEIIYADTNIVFNGENVANYPRKSKSPKIYIKEDDFENPFFVEFRGEKRWMRPDLIRNENNEKENSFSYQSNIKITSVKVIEKKCKLQKCQKEHQFINFKVESLNSGNEQDVNILIKKLRKNLALTPMNRGFNSSHLNTSFNNNFIESYPISRFMSFFSEYISKNTLKHIIVDWKYMDDCSFFSKTEKIDTDINKQMCYEFCLKEYKKEIFIESQFIIPYFYNVYNIESNNKIVSPYFCFINSKIEVFKANFQLIQDIYLNHD